MRYYAVAEIEIADAGLGPRPRHPALRFLESDAYRPYRERRRTGAPTELLLVAGEDAALGWDDVGTTSSMRSGPATAGG